ncbi:MAG: RNA polymerase sigma factor [Jatrophihabitantaceae bacterium]
MSVSDIDDALVDAARGGDDAAVRRIYHALSPAVLGYLRVHGASDPEAATSEVFVAVFDRIARLSGGAAGLRTLLFSVAHARMVDDRRVQARRPRTVEYLPADDRRHVPSAEDDALESLAAERVRAILALLPSDQGEVLRLRIVADLSIEQVAEVIGRSAGAVKQLQRRALIALRAELSRRPERRVTR